MPYRGVAEKLKQTVDKITEGSFVLLLILASQILGLHPHQHFFFTQWEFTDKPAHHQHSILVRFILSRLFDLIDVADHVRQQITVGFVKLFFQCDLMYLTLRQRPKGQRLAAGDDRRQNPVLIFHNQNREGIRALRLFQKLQQAVERLGRRVLRVVENIDFLSAALQSGFIETFLQRANFLFFNRLGRAVQKNQIGIVALRNPLAVDAFFTGESVVNVLTDPALR